MCKSGVSAAAQLSRRMLLVVVFVLAVLLPTTAHAAPVPQLDTEASLFDPAVPSGDPCVVYDVRVDAERFVSPTQPPQLEAYDIGVINSCTGAFVDEIGALELPLAIDESAFTVAPANTSAELNVTVPGFDPFDQTTAPLTMHLHWSQPPGSSLADGLAVVTGTLSRGSLAITLDNSITWNPWGSATFPWAGLWLCRSVPLREPVQQHPGCVGQG